MFAGKCYNILFGKDNLLYFFLDFVHANRFRSRFDLSTR